MANPLLSFLSRGVEGLPDANAPLRLAALRQERLREAGPLQDTSQLRGDIAADPYTGKAAQAETADQDKLRQMLFSYNRPDVRAQREEELGNRIKEKVAPAHEAGLAQIEAAKIAGPYRVATAEATAQGKSDVANQTNANNAANRAAMAARQQLGKLTTKGRPGGFWNMFTNAGSDYDKELQQLSQQAGLEAAGGPQGSAPTVEAVAQALQAQGIDPRHAPEVLNDPQALAELGF